MRTQKKVRDIATEEWIQPAFDPNAQQGWGGGFPQGGGWQPGFVQSMPSSPTDPEEYERWVEAKNTTKVDMWDILAEAAWAWKGM
jgi:hypothetical protein